MNSNVRLFYNVINTTIDKERAWYSVKDNLIYIRDKELLKSKYYLEADTCTSDAGRQLYIIFSEEKIDKACRPCRVDNFGRLKIHPVSHREYFRTLYENDSNIQFNIVEYNEQYIACRI